MKAWYFSKADCRLRYGDGRLIKAGVTHTVDCEPVLCRVGLHGSRDIWDALAYAPGSNIWRTEHTGHVIEGDDKLASTERTYLWGYDASDVLRHFARLCALDVVHLWDAPEVVIKFLKTEDESLRSAAYSAADSAADWAAYPASAARAAASWAVSWAAESAADSAYLAANSAEYPALRQKQSRRLYRMIMENRP